MTNLQSVVSVSNTKLEFTPSLEIKEGIGFCPISYSKGKRILRKTLANHVKPKYWELIRDDGFFFCGDLDCPITYFNNSEKLYFGLSDVVTSIMHKMPINTENRPMCYCKNVLESVIIDELLNKQCCDSIIDIQKFTEANTGKDCAITNPTGRCCGKQIKEVLEWTKEQRYDISVPLLEEAVSCCSQIEKSTDTQYEDEIASQ